MNTFKEEFNMLMILHGCRGDNKAAKILFNERYLNYPRKSHVSFFRLKKKRLQYGCTRPKRSRQSTIVNEENQQILLLM